VAPTRARFGFLDKLSASSRVNDSFGIAIKTKGTVNYLCCLNDLIATGNNRDTNLRG
jgi:hypothetical protein